MILVDNNQISAYHSNVLLQYLFAFSLTLFLLFMRFTREKKQVENFLYELTGHFNKNFFVVKKRDIMNFCDECNNLMFPVEDREQKRLVFKCKQCQNKISVQRGPKQYCVYTNYVQMEEETKCVAFIDAIVNPDVILDPTLPRTKDVKCPKCSNNEAVFFNAQSKNPDEAMNLFLFVAFFLNSVSVWSLYFGWFTKATNRKLKKDYTFSSKLL
ncbi:hypothetical protein RFI_19056 [Reticulomyxa filosa]|uniref:DNA-directed RNA polymerase II subunit RPB9-like zinc ribbon domain-containing protein n=1 Tax=Reticulomyxa filosa TaxID=46433 RepID=X6MX62_RETFI|nr:hypothetical protein RFI_19056 [Reticulomyxa filosa]|eukprot:ETO18226.1 hypothetical protein RFI_19056 [Reticulomyxa filosa]